MMQEIMTYLPLANFLFAFLVVPIWRLGSAIVQSNKNQQAEINELKKMNKALTAVALKFFPADASREYFAELQRHDG